MGMTHPTYFASGTNHPAEIDGFARCAINVGATVPHLRAGAAEALVAAAASGRAIFLDSGAFGEVGFDAAGPFVKAEITAEEWTRRLDVAEALAGAIGPALFFVAPDKVAFQADTLERLRTYAPRVRAIRALHANVIVPHQKGELSLADFHDAAAELLGFSDFVVGVPMKKDATTIDDLVELLAARPVARLHLLGMGPHSRSWDRTLAAIAEASPATVVFCDSVEITRQVGRTNGPNGGPRAMTAAQDDQAAEVAARTFRQDADGLDYTDAIALPGEWLTLAGLRRLAAELLADGLDVDGFVEDPAAWLQVDDRHADPRVEFALDQAWAAFFQKGGTAAFRKREAILDLYAPGAAAQEDQTMTAAAASQAPSDTASRQAPRDVGGAEDARRPWLALVPGPGAMIAQFADPLHFLRPPRMRFASG